MPIDFKGLQKLADYIRHVPHYIPQSIPIDWIPLQYDEITPHPQEFSMLFECGIRTGTPPRTVGGIVLHGIGLKNEAYSRLKYGLWDDQKILDQCFARCYGFPKKEEFWPLTSFYCGQNNDHNTVDRLITPQHAATAIEHFIAGARETRYIWPHIFNVVCKKPDDIISQENHERDSVIRQCYHPSDAPLLSLKYGLSEAQVRRIFRRDTSAYISRDTLAKEGHLLGYIIRD